MYSDKPSYMREKYISMPNKLRFRLCTMESVQIHTNMYNCCYYIMVISYIYIIFTMCPGGLMCYGLRPETRTINACLEPWLFIKVLTLDYLS